MQNVTLSFIDHCSSGLELRVLWGTVNGVPVHMPMGTRGIVVSSEWLRANPPPVHLSKPVNK